MAQKTAPLLENPTKRLLNMLLVQLLDETLQNREVLAEIIALKVDSDILSAALAGDTFESPAKVGDAVDYQPRYQKDRVYFDCTIKSIDRFEKTAAIHYKYKTTKDDEEIIKSDWNNNVSFNEFSPI